MHELSIVQSIIEISEAAARANDSRAILAIKVRLGEFTTLTREALEFSFEIARRGTLAANAALEIEPVPMELHCALCGRVSHPQREVRLICPHCGLPLEIVSGEELQVEYIELDEARH